MSNQLEKWDPIKEFNQLGHRLSSFFSEKDGSAKDTGEFFDSQLSEWNPAVDISEDDKEYLITADLPEVKKEEMAIGIENGVLSISGERKTESEKEDKKKKYHRVERSYGSYQRTFRLPDNVEEDGIEAQFDNGVLRIHLPKGESPSQKQIHIN